MRAEILGQAQCRGVNSVGLAVRPHDYVCWSALVPLRTHKILHMLCTIARVMAALVTRTIRFGTERARVTTDAFQVVCALHALKVRVPQVNAANPARLLRIERVLLPMTEI